MSTKRYYTQSGMYHNSEVSISMSGPQTAEHVCEHVQEILDKPHVKQVIVIREDQVNNTDQQYFTAYTKTPESPPKKHDANNPNPLPTMRRT